MPLQQLLILPVLMPVREVTADYFSCPDEEMSVHDVHHSLDHLPIYSTGCHLADCAERHVADEQHVQIRSAGCLRCLLLFFELIILSDCDPYHLLYLLKGYADPYLILSEKSLCKKSNIAVVYCKINVLSAVNSGGTDSDDLTKHI